MDSKTISNLILILEQSIPLLIKAATDIWPVIQELIATIMSSEQATPEQLAATAALKKQADEAFDAAVKARLAQIGGYSE